jgi:hypothetical protein
MDTVALFDTFDSLLAEEREAIRHLDGKTVDEIAVKKLATMDALVALPVEERTKHVARMSALVLGLKRNGILLVQGRGVLLDILRLKGAQLSNVGSTAVGFGRAPNAQMSRPRLSVRG